MGIDQFSCYINVLAITIVARNQIGMSNTNEVFSTR